MGIREAKQLLDDGSAWRERDRIIAVFRKWQNIGRSLLNVYNDLLVI